MFQTVCEDENRLVIDRRHASTGLFDISMDGPAAEDGDQDVLDVLDGSESFLWFIRFTESDGTVKKDKIIITMTSLTNIVDFKISSLKADGVILTLFGANGDILNTLAVCSVESFNIQRHKYTKNNGYTIKEA